MQNEARIVVRRIPYEEPYHTQVEIAASSGGYSGIADFYCNVDDLLDIGRALQEFPKKVPDSYEFVYGSEDTEQQYYRYLRIRAYTTDMAGHCAIQFVMNLNEAEPEEGRCAFSIRAEPGAINRLGRLFERLHAESGSEFRWTPTTDDFTSSIEATRKSLRPD